jgi:hypothetical protein
VPTPLHQIDPSIPEPLEAIVMTALQKDPAARQQTMADLSAQLQQFLRVGTGAQPLLGVSGASGAQPLHGGPAPGAVTPSTPSWSRRSQPGGPPSGAQPLAAGAPGRSAALGTAPTTFSAAASQSMTAPEPVQPPVHRSSRAPVVVAALVLIALASVGGLLWMRTHAGTGSADPTIAAGIAGVAGATGAAGGPVAQPNPSPPESPTLKLPAVVEAKSPPEEPAPAAGTTPDPDGVLPPDLEAAAAARAGGTTGLPTTETAEPGDKPTPAEKSRPPIAKPAARSPGRAHALYEKAFEHRAAGEEDKALLGYRAALRAEGLSVGERADAETQVINLSRKYGEIEIIGASGAVIAVDGREVGRTPLGDPLLVRPGNHVVTMQLPGYQLRTDRVAVAAGQKRLLTVKPTR